MLALPEVAAVDPRKALVYLVCAPIAFFLLRFAQRLYASVFGPLKNVPGPWLARFTRLWELKALSKGDFEKQNIDLHKRYGKLVRISPNKYTVDDPEAVRIIYGHGTKFVKTRFYTAFGDAPSNLFSELDVHTHSGQRRRIASLYSMTTLLSYEGFIDRCNTTLTEKFSQFAKDGRAVQMVEFFQFYAFDVIGAITAGRPFGLMEKESDFPGIIQGIHEAITYGGYFGLFPDVHKLLSLFKRGDAALYNYVMHQIALRRQGDVPEDTNDFLTKLLKWEQEGKNTPADTFNSIGSNIGAGSDTTAITLSSILYNLLKHPETLRKLREEIITKTREGAISDPVTYREAQDQLPYLQAVLKEGLRVHPAVGQPLVRIVPKGGAVISGQYFPEKTEVGINPWVAHYNEDIFGPDAKEFRPERWLASKEEVARLDSYFMPFGHGSRTCIGKHISLLEISKVIPQLVRKFDFEFVKPDAEWETTTAWFTKQKFWCYIKARAQ